MQFQEHFLLVFLLCFKMQVLKLLNVFIQIGFLCLFITVDEKDCSLHSWWHQNVDLFETLYSYHVSHKVAEFTSCLWLLESYFTEPFAQKRNGEVNTWISATQKVNQLLPILSMHGFSNFDSNTSVFFNFFNCKNLFAFD